MGRWEAGFTHYDTTAGAVERESATWSEESENVAQWLLGLPVTAFLL